MSLHAAGIDLDKACVLIALERQFGYVDEFLIDYFLEFGENGFNSDHFYLIAESMPGILIQHGSFSIVYKQGYVYVIIYDRVNNIRYRLPPHALVTFMYIDAVDSTKGHALAIFASEIAYFIKKEKFVGMILPLNMLVDNRTYEQDIADGYIT